MPDRSASGARRRRARGRAASGPRVARPSAAMQYPGTLRISASRNNARRRYSDMRMLRIIGALLLALAALGRALAQPVAIPGTSVTMNAPEGFTLSRNFAGL